MNYQKRDKFFYAHPKLFPEWDYESRLAIGVNLADFKARNAPVFRFVVKGKTYEIERTKAFELGKRYTMKFGKLPNLIPLEEFREVEEARLF